MAVKTENPWTTKSLMNDHHLGSRREAALIERENGHQPAAICGRCGEPSAYYRYTIGAVQCIDCRAIRYGATWDQGKGDWVRDEAGEVVIRWSK